MTQVRSAGEEPRILVLGSGFIGSGVSRFLRAQGVDVTVMSRAQPVDSHVRYMGNPTALVGDAGDIHALRAALEGRTHVLFAVSSLMPGESEADPTGDMALLLRSLTASLQALTEHPNTSFTFLSSGGTVYGEPEQIPTPEDAPTEPIGAYGIVRLAAEKFILRHRRLHGNTVKVARLANVYGPGQSTAHGQGVIAAAIRHASEGTPMHLFGNGDVRRDFIYLDDAAEYLARYALEPKCPPVINVGSGRSDSMETVIATVREVTGRRLEVVHEPARPFDVSTVELDITRLRSLMDINPRSLRDGIEDTWRATKVAQEQLRSVQPTVVTGQ